MSVVHQIKKLKVSDYDKNSITVIHNRKHYTTYTYQLEDSILKDPEGSNPETYLLEHDIHIPGFIEEYGGNLKSFIVTGKAVITSKAGTFNFPLLDTIPAPIIKTYTLTFGTSIYRPEYGRITIVAGVSGAGKTHTAMLNAKWVLDNKHFTRVLYIAKELGNESAKQRFLKATSSTVSAPIHFVEHPTKVTEKNLIHMLNQFKKQFPTDSVMVVLDNGTNFALEVEDTSRTGQGKLGVELHEWLLAHKEYAVLWLTQIQRSNIKDLFTTDKQGTRTFNMSLGDLKASSVLQELADTVIGIARDTVTGSYHNTLLKGDPNNVTTITLKATGMVPSL